MTGDYLRLWEMNYSGGSSGSGQSGGCSASMIKLLNNNKNSEFCAPLTSFDWNDTVCVSSAPCALPAALHGPVKIAGEAITCLLQLQEALANSTNCRAVVPAHAHHFSARSPACALAFNVARRTRGSLAHLQSTRRAPSGMLRLVRQKPS